MNYSPYQLKIFDFAANGFGHGCVESVAGSGKSTTAVAMIEKFSSMEQGLFSSFTRSTVEDLAGKITAKGLSNVESKTYNSFGNRIIRQYLRPFPKMMVDYPGHKTDLCMKYDVFKGKMGKSYYKSKNAIIRLISLFKNLAITEVLQADRQWDDIVDTYDVTIPDIDNFKQLALDTFRASIDREDIIDYDDQKFLPILHGWPIPQYDFVVLDEYQDSCPVERELMLRACNGGRIVVFGDSNQAIYSFKGTTPDSMADFTKLKQATRLNLSICYRCSKAVVREAQSIVPEIEYHPDSPEGSVRRISHTQFLKSVTQKDMVLARVTEDLVLSVNDFLTEGRAAYIEGREYGTQLEYFLEKVNPDGNESIDTLHNAVEAHYSEKSQQLNRFGKENQLLQLESKVATVKALMLDCTSVKGLIKKIETIFKDKSSGIRHLTIHKAKGLEADYVHILRPDKIPHKRSKNLAEERRLKYVAITRARKDLNYVAPGPSN